MPSPRPVALLDRPSGRARTSLGAVLSLCVWVTAACGAPVPTQEALEGALLEASALPHGPWSAGSANTLAPTPGADATSGSPQPGPGDPAAGLASWPGLSDDCRAALSDFVRVAPDTSAYVHRSYARDLTSASPSATGTSRSAAGTAGDDTLDLTLHAHDKDAPELPDGARAAARCPSFSVQVGGQSLQGTLAPRDYGLEHTTGLLLDLRAPGDHVVMELARGRSGATFVDVTRTTPAAAGTGPASAPASTGPSTGPSTGATTGGTGSGVPDPDVVRDVLRQQLDRVGRLG